MCTHMHEGEEQVERHVTVQGKNTVQLLIEALKLQASPTYRQARL